MPWVRVGRLTTALGTTRLSCTKSQPGDSLTMHTTTSLWIHFLNASLINASLCHLARWIGRFADPNACEMDNTWCGLGAVLKAIVEHWNFKGAVIAKHCLSFVDLLLCNSVARCGSLHVSYRRPGDSGVTLLRPVERMPSPFPAPRALFLSSPSAHTLAILRTACTCIQKPLFQLHSTASARRSPSHHSKAGHRALQRPLPVARFAVVEAFTDGFFKNNLLFPFPRLR